MPIVHPEEVNLAGDLGATVVVWKNITEADICEPFGVGAWEHIGIQLVGTYGSDGNTGLVIEGAMFGFREIDSAIYQTLREAGRADLTRYPSPLAAREPTEHPWNVFERVNLIRPRIVDGTNWDVTVYMAMFQGRR